MTFHDSSLDELGLDYCRCKGCARPLGITNETFPSAASAELARATAAAGAVTVAVAITVAAAVAGVKVKYE